MVVSGNAKPATLAHVAALVVSVLRTQYLTFCETCKRVAGRTGRGLIDQNLGTFHISCGRVGHISEDTLGEFNRQLAPRYD
jgi:hypothetical protein